MAPEGYLASCGVVEFSEFGRGRRDGGSYRQGYALDGREARGRQVPHQVAI
jgi:hypothetical protein